MAFEIPRISSSTAPLHTPEASNLRPSARPCFQADSLGSYAKAEQHGDGCCATLLGGVWKCASFLLRGAWNCLTGCLGMVCGCGKLEKIVDIQDEEAFNCKFHTPKNIGKFLERYDMERGVFPKFTTGRGLLNCIVGVHHHPKAEQIFPLLVEHVIDNVHVTRLSLEDGIIKRVSLEDAMNAVHNKTLSVEILDFRKPIPSDPFYERGADYTYTKTPHYQFVLRFILRVLEKEDANVHIFDAIRYNDDYFFDLIYNEQLLKDLGRNQRERLTNWAETEQPDLYQRFLKTVGDKNVL
jgi:hypothetical protein